MPLMNVFEPLFLLLALTTLVTTGIALILAVSGRLARAGRIVRRWLVGAAVYFLVVIVVSIVTPQRTFAVGDPQCFDDWCIAVQGSHPAGGLDLDVTLRVSNRARRVPMGERGAGVILIDGQGRRYLPVAQPSDVPLETKIDPDTAFDTTRRFHVSAEAPDLAIVYTHETGFPIGWLIISEGGWFAKSPRMLIQ